MLFSVRKEPNCMNYIVGWNRHNSEIRKVCVAVILLSSVRTSWVRLKLYYKISRNDCGNISIIRDRMGLSIRLWVLLLQIYFVLLFVFVFDWLESRAAFDESPWCFWTWIWTINVFCYLALMTCSWRLGKYK